MGHINYSFDQHYLNGGIVEPTIRVLYSEFGYVIKREMELEQEKEKNPEPELEKRIENNLLLEFSKFLKLLKEYKFTTEKKLHYISLEKIKEMFRNLRDKQIEFYEAIFENFKKNGRYYVDKLKSSGYHTHLNYSSLFEEIEKNRTEKNRTD